MQQIRDRHLSAILRQILTGGPIGRKRLATATGISLTTITRLTADLVADGILREQPSAPQRRSAGRPEVPLALHPDGPLLAGVHIRSRATTCSVFNLQGHLVHRRAAQYSSDAPGTVLRNAIALTRRTFAETPGAPGRVAGIGVSTGGTVDATAGTVVESPRLQWHDVEIRAPFRAEFDRHVVVDNSVRGLAISHRWADHDWRGATATVFVGLAVSAALVDNGTVVRGSANTAGSIAHIGLPGGPGRRCSCGAVDCVDALVPDAAVHAEATARGWLPHGSRAAAIYNTQGVYAEELAALRLLRAERLGQLLGTVAAVMDPVRVVVCGHIGTPTEIDHCLATAREHDRRAVPGRSLARFHHRPVPAEDWDAASAALVLDDYLRSPTSYSTN